MKTVEKDKEFIDLKGKTEEEIFEMYQRYVGATIRRKFRNIDEFCKMHMLERSDIIQLGNWGLIKGIRSYKEESNTSFKTHIINHIIWNIKTQGKGASLRSLNSQTFEVADVVSANTPVGEEDVSIIDTIQSEDVTEDIKLETIIAQALLDADTDFEKEIINIISMRLQEKTFDEIGKELGVTGRSVSKKLTTKKAKKVIDELLLKVKGD